MKQIRPLTLVVLSLLLPTLGAIVASSFYELEIETLREQIKQAREERLLYTNLANQAVGVSERSFTFALRYQGTLDICLQRLYGASVPAVAASLTLHKGGIGGPYDVREPSRLP